MAMRKPKIISDLESFSSKKWADSGRKSQKLVSTAGKCGTNLIFFCAHMWLRSVFVMTVWIAQTTWNLIFSILICATSIYGAKSNTSQMFCIATAVWTVISEFMRFLHHSRSTFVIIGTLQKFYKPKVIKTRGRPICIFQGRCRYRLLQTN